MESSVLGERRSPERTGWIGHRRGWPVCGRTKPQGGRRNRKCEIAVANHPSGYRASEHDGVPRRASRCFDEAVALPPDRVGVGGRISLREAAAAIIDPNTDRFPPKLAGDN
jgi:hypothetical protein